MLHKRRTNRRTNQRADHKFFDSEWYMAIRSHIHHRDSCFGCGHFSAFTVDTNGGNDVEVGMAPLLEPRFECTNEEK